MQNSILKEAKMVEYDYMLKVLKKLKIYTKSVPEAVNLSIYINIYLCSFVD